MRANCRQCGVAHDVGEAVAGKVLGGLGGSTLGPAVYQLTRSKVLGAACTLVGGMIGAAAGHTLVDAGAAALCPQCSVHARG
jgi:uncharacterized protein YcfJ